MSAIDGGATSEWRRHWRVVAAACTGVALATINIYSTGLFAEPLRQAFGWTRAEVMSAVAFPAMSGTLLGPFVGMAIDRFGPRRIGITGAVLFCVLTSAQALAGPAIWSWWAIWTMIALANVMVSPAVWAAGVVSVFTASRGLALAFTLCGSSVGSIVMPLLAYYLIEMLGWRQAFVALAVIAAAICLPLIIRFFSSDKDEARMARTTTTRGRRGAGMPLSALFGSSRFLRLLFAAFLIAGVIVPMIISLVPILEWNGLSRGQAAGVAAASGIASIMGRLTIGLLLDRIHGPYLAAATVLLPVGAVVILLEVAGSVASASAAAFILGFALGAEYDIVAYLASRYFTLRQFGTVFATIVAAISLSGGIGPTLIAAVFDHTGSYLPALIAAIPMCVMSAVLFLFLGPYPMRSSEAED